MIDTDITQRQQAFLNDLRNATAAQHKRLEASRLSQNLMSPDVSIEEYTAYLAHMKNVIAWCEENIFPVTADLFDDIESRRKLPLIERDLTLLQSGTKGAGVNVPGAYDHTAITHLPAALGYMYVIEGSTLGGRMILNHIKATLGIDEQNGASFFAGYEAETGKLWKRFLDIFSRYTVENDVQNGVIASAADAFKSIENYFA